MYPQGKKDYLCRVLHFNPTSQTVKVQLYNNEKHDGQLEKVQPTWYDPEDESKEAYCGTMKQKQKYPKYKPWVLERYLDEFYQQEIKSKLKSQPGTSKFSKVTLPRHLKAGIRKFKPLQ